MSVDQDKMAAACRIMAQSVAEVYSVPMDDAKRVLMVRALYATDATWSDPMTECRGVDSIVSNFQSLACVAGSGKLEVDHASFKRDREAGEGTLWFHATASYRIRMTPFKLSIKQWSVLRFSSITGQIVDHRDEWSVESLISNVPVVGRLYQSVFRPGVGAAVDGILGGYMRLMARRASAAAALAMEKQAAIEAGEMQPQPQYIRNEPRMPSADGSDESSTSEEYNVPFEEAVRDPTTIEDVQTALKQEIRKYVELRKRSTPPTGNSPYGSYGSPVRYGTSPPSQRSIDAALKEAFVSTPPRRSMELERNDPRGVGIPRK